MKLMSIRNIKLTFFLFISRTLILFKVGTCANTMLSSSKAFIYLCFVMLYYSSIVINLTTTQIFHSVLKCNYNLNIMINVDHKCLFEKVVNGGGNFETSHFASYNNRRGN